MKTTLSILALLVVTIVVADFIYSRVVLARWAKWERGVTRGNDGVRQHCEAIQQGEGRVALLLVHGFADSPAVYRKYVPALAEKGYACHAIRLPGWAQPLEEMRKVDAEDWRTAIGSELEALRKTHDEVWVIAHSLGAGLSLELASRGELHADGLVAITPMIEVANKRSPVLTPAQWFKVSKALLHLSSVVESVFAVDMRDESMRGNLYRDTFVPRNIYDALFDVMAGLKGKAKDITLPTLMILAEEDLIVETAAADRYFKRLGAAVKKLVVVEDSGHVVPLDHDWEVTTEIIDAFIQAEVASAVSEEDGQIRE